MRLLNYVLLLITILTALNCKENKTANSSNGSDAVKLNKIADEYYENYLKLYPLEATIQGDSRYNDQLAINISQDFIAKELSFYVSTQAQLKTIYYKNLTADQQVIFDVLDYTLKDKIEQYAYHPEYIPFTQFGGLPLDFPLLGSGTGSQPFNTEKDYENWLKRMQRFPVWMDAAINNFRTGIEKKVVLPKKLVEKMIPQMNAEEITSSDKMKNIFYGPVKNFPKTFTAQQKQHFTEEYSKAINNHLIPSYQKMAAFLEKEYLVHARISDGYYALPNGSNIYQFYVKSWTTTNLTPDAIKKTGEEQVAMLRSEMEKVKNEVGFNGSLEAFLTYVKTDKNAMPYRSSAEVLTAFHGILSKIQPKLKTMFNITPKTGFEIKQTEKFREASASAEYKQGTPDGKRPGIFYIPLPNPSQFNVTSGMESLFLHEAIPGHHYQVSLQQENEKIPKFMRFGWFGAYGEGWAHYCETLGPEFGLYADPYQKLGYLSDQMLRAVRLVIDTGLHTGTMSREQAIQYFLNNVAYDAASATAEVERYMAMPGQALGYKIGALKIRELRTTYEKKMGKQFNLASFHDEILNQGCLPLSVLERKMERWSNQKK